MLGVYNYTVVLTYMAMLVSFLGITVASGGNTHGALVCLMIAGFFDMFDGKIASTKKNRTVSERKFGIQIDSLSDLISFGVLPAIIIYNANESKAKNYAFYIAALYALCALIRLAWFNVDEEERQEGTTEERKYYSGLPVTSAALLLPLAMGISAYFTDKLGLVGCISLGVMAICFITPFRLKKPALLGKIMVLLCGGVEAFLLFAGADI